LARAFSWKTVRAPLAISHWKPLRKRRRRLHPVRRQRLHQPPSTENTFAHQLQIKPSRDLVGIAKLVEIPHIIATTAGFPANSLAELIALAKKDPGKINYASAGLGSYPHLDMEKLMKAAGIQMTHIPYKGGPVR